MPGALEEPAPLPTADAFVDGDNRIPGELLLTLDADATASLEDRSTYTVAGAMSVEALGVTGALPPLQATLEALGVTSMQPLYGPSPPTVRYGMAMAVESAPTLDVRVRFDAGIDLSEATDQLRDTAGVLHAEANRYRTTCLEPNDPRFAEQWGLAAISAPAAWDRTTGDAAVAVAVVDTGVDLQHRELAGLLLPGQNLVDLGPNPVAPRDWVFEGTLDGAGKPPQDEVGHGTHVAGTIGCESNNGVGVTGVTWGCRLLPVRVLARARHKNGQIAGFGSAADIAAGIRWSSDHGARVVNLSLGSRDATEVERRAVDYAWGRGAVVVAAMGNDNSDVAAFPAAFPDVIAVGAVDRAHGKAAFSNEGAHIGVVAPGVEILSTHWGTDSYASMNGTSMATPHVAGVAALILSAAPDLTNDDVARILRETATPLGTQADKHRFGAGLVNAEKAVAAAQAAR